MLSNKSDVAINVAFMQIVVCMHVCETRSGKFRSGVTLPGHASRTTRTNITAGRENEKRLSTRTFDLLSILLDVALAKCQRATIPAKQILIGHVRYINILTWL